MPIARELVLFMINVYRHQLSSRLVVALFVLACSLALLQQSSIGQTVTPPPPPPPPALPSPTPVFADEDEEIVRIASNLVVVPVSVTDANGQPVLGLTANDFQIEEQGRVQDIAQVGNAESVPLELALLVDVSGSTRARFAFERTAATEFLRAVLTGGADRATIFAIDSTPRQIAARGTVQQATVQLMRLEPSRGFTAFFDTVGEAARYLHESTPPQRRRVIVCISDGENTYSERFHAAAAVLPQVQRADTVFYSINPNGRSLWLNRISVRGQRGMEQVATETGGASFTFDEPQELNAVFRRIAAELRAQYLLQYYSNNNAPSGRYLSISVRALRRSALRIRARQGYYVPTPR